MYGSGRGNDASNLPLQCQASREEMGQTCICIFHLVTIISLVYSSFSIIVVAIDLVRNWLRRTIDNQKPLEHNLTSLELTLYNKIYL